MFIGAELAPQNGLQDTLPIRERLKQWQEVNEADLQDNDASIPGDDGLLRLGNPDDLRQPVTEEDRQESASEISRLSDPDLGREITILRRGDLVELKSVGSTSEPVLGIYVQKFDAQFQFYTMQGKFWHRKLKNVMFTVPEFVEAAKVDELLPYLPTGPLTEEELDRAHMLDLSVPRNVGSGMVKKLNGFWHAAEAFYRQHASVLDNAHRILAHPSDLRFATLDKIARKLIGTPAPLPQSALYAVHKALGHSGLGFNIDHRSHRVTSVFQILSQDQVELVEEVKQWIREYQNHLASKAGPHAAGRHASKEDRRTIGTIHIENFIKKARRLVRKSREIRSPSPSGSLGPSVLQPTGNRGHHLPQAIFAAPFTDADKRIIKFMESWCVSKKFMVHTELQALPPIILRGVGEYEGFNLDVGLGFMFLQEIGVFLPYENRITWDEHLLLPLSDHSKPLAKMADYLNSDKLLEDLKLPDTMADLRKDWKDLDAYCIDTLSARELDDAISVETIANEPDRYWVHVHVAHPSAFFGKQHMLAKMAAHMTETIYFPETSYTMLPETLTQSYFSLAPNRPVLTFSAKMTGKGQILDTKIQAGTLRKATRLTPTNIRQLLGFSTARSPMPRLRVGGGASPADEPEQASLPPLSPKQEADLKTLFALATARHKVRSEATMFFPKVEPDVSVHGAPDTRLPRLMPSRDVARFMTGDPIITIEGHENRSPFHREAHPADLLVPELMMLAGEIAGRWCAKRNIPAIFRGTIVNPEGLDEDTFQREVLGPCVNAEGTPSLADALRYLRLYARGTPSTTPIRHDYVGVECYIKATSPLRRYGDMLLHWQLDAALREEARTGESLVNSKRDDYLSFSRTELEIILNRLQSRERLIFRAKNIARKFWVSQLFLRAFHFHEAALPETYKILIHSALDRETLVGASEYYGIDFSMYDPQRCGLPAAAIGDWWEVKLDRVMTFTPGLNVVPVRLISRNA